MIAEVLTGVCALAMVALVVAEAKNATVAKYISKPIASLAFILVAVAGGALGVGDHSYAGWIVAGLVLGAGGDVSLMLPGKRAFMVGLVLFLFGHIAYIIACVQVVSVENWLSIYVALPIAAAVGALAYLWPHLGSMKIPVIAYVITITLMVVAAIAVIRVETRPILEDVEARLLLAGAILFFASDLFVARERFVAEGLVNRAVGLPAYYAGQLLFAWSTLG